MLTLAILMVLFFLVHMLTNLELLSAAKNKRKPQTLTRPAYIASGLCFALLLLIFAFAVVALLNEAGVAT